MELSDEEKKRILEEEQRRLAEERYRESVRAKLRSDALAGDTSSPQHAIPIKASLRLRVGSILTILLIVFALAFVIYMAKNSDAVRPDSVPSRSLLHPFNRPILSGSVAVSPQQCRYWKFDVGASAVNARVAGNFHAVGGLGNDIEAVVAESSECENWMNGHQAHILYSSGKVTNGTLDVPIHQAGNFCLAFSNRMALISGKTVSGNISLQYLLP